MSVTRREFLKGCAVGAAAASLPGMAGWEPALAAAAQPDPIYRSLMAVALETAQKLGASYADMRVCRYHVQDVSLRTQPDLRTGAVLHVPEVDESRSFGFGVRVLVKGTWGFAASPRVEKEEVARIAREAVGVAQANVALQRTAVQLAPVKPAEALWRTPYRKDPFEVSVKDKLAFLQAINEEVRKVPKVFSVVSQLRFRSEHKFLASTDGSYIEQYLQQVIPEYTATAVDRETRTRRERSYGVPAVTGGYEYIEQAQMLENARRVGEECVEHLSAPPIEPGRKDLVIMPSNLSLTIHESIGHSTELDRALGYEANFAGTSFLTPDKLGTYRVGSELVTIVGDRTLPGGLSTCGYDDEGVPTTRFHIIKDGIFVGYQTIRDQAHLVGDKESHACCYADSYDSIPFQRIPNVWLLPGPKPMTLDHLIGGVEDGVLIEGLGSWSIDQQRYNFQFGGDAFWEIKGGKKGRMISRVAYQARSDEFWQACDAIADSRFWENQGLTGDGKGQPPQTNSMSHGCAPARFRRINVLRTE
ncbi:MAG: twin-arginine translocation signal domain-containing protein [Acidobacteria bacterium]|nr:twin-arginine translocation signal domain-containing protein [Acidobacteriota bacterium]